MKTVNNHVKTIGLISGIIALIIIGTTAFNVFGKPDETQPPKEKQAEETTVKASEPKPPASPKVMPKADADLLLKERPASGTAFGGLKIGLVNIVEAFDKFEKRRKYTESLEREKTQKHQEIKKIENEIMKLKAEIGELDKLKEMRPDNPLRRKKELDIKIFSLKMENMVKSWNEYINGKVNEQTVVLYNEIREAIDNYAQKHNFTLILKTDPSRLEKEPEESAILRINTRAVLYYEKAMDITNDIIKLLNKG